VHHIRSRNATAVSLTCLARTEPLATAMRNSVLNSLDPRGNHSATSNNMKLVHCPTQAPLHCTKCNSLPINGQCTNFILFDVALWLPRDLKGWKKLGCRSEATRAPCCWKFCRVTQGHAKLHQWFRCTLLFIIIIIITYFISCWQNAAKQYVVIVKLVKIKKKKNVQIKIKTKQIDVVSN